MKRRCCKCGRRARALANGKYWLCGDCAEKATIESLAMGAPVIQAVRGEPQFLIIPRGAHSDN